MISANDKKYFPYIFPTVIFISVFAGCLALGPLLFNVDGDLGRHLTLGKYILDSRTIPIRDIFSETMYGQALSPHEWLAAVLFRLFYAWNGLSGVVLFASLLFGCVFWLITYRVYRNSLSTPITLILVILGIAGSRIHWLARPHIFTYLFLFLWIELLTSPIRFRWKWTISIGLMFLWVNTHGAFVTGYVVTGMMAAGIFLDTIRKHDWRSSVTSIREMLLILVTGLLVSLANPSGPAIWQTIIGFLGSRYLVSHTVEYMPPVLYHAGVMPFTILALLALILIVLRWKHLSFVDMLLLAGFAVFAVGSGRNIPLFILVALPILAREYALLLPKFRMALDRQYAEDDLTGDSRSRVHRAGFLAAVGLVVLILGIGIFRFVPSLEQRNRYQPDRFPVDAIDWLQAHPQTGNVFNEFGWGGYILYRLWPDQKVFIDGQTDFYGEALTRDYETISSVLPGWEAKLDQHQVSWVLLPAGSRLAEKLVGSPGWTQVYGDDTAVILHR